MAFDPEKLPDARAYEERFSFIDDENLRTNVCVSFQYITFLLSLLKEFSIQGPIQYSINKDIIVNTATIIECCLYYCIKKFLETGRVTEQEIKGFKWEDLGSPNLIYTINDSEAIFWTKRKKKGFELGTQFRDINIIAKRINVLDEMMYKKADAMRANRNKIHLAGLDNADFFVRKDVEEAFKIAGEILEVIEEKLGIPQHPVP